MKLSVLEGDIHLHDLRTRMPFKYGIATMTHMPVAFVRLRVEVDGRVHTGIASDLLPPKWFTKDPAKAPDVEILEMLEVIRHAVESACGLDGDSAFDLWRQLYAAQSAWAAVKLLPPLLAHFGTSLVERALIEAVCRATGRPFHDCIRTGVLGLRPGEVHAGLSDTLAAAALPRQPLASLILRHTVGLADPLTDEEIPAGERVHDGLPQSLRACIRAYGLRHFKLKVNGDLERDLERVARIAGVIQAECGGDFRFTLDGNEQFKSVGQFRQFWEALQRRPDLATFLPLILFVEQPLHRAVALEPAVGAELAAWPERPPCIIDESDGALESLPTALALGYDGTSHKNCKGVFKGILNRCLLARDTGGTRPRVMSGEDLCNVGPVALLQDLAVMAALGIESVERNGHHYNAGLSQFPAGVQRQVSAAHPDLYHVTAAGWPTLTVEQGRIRLGSINASPFGTGFELDLAGFTPAPNWRPAVG